MPEILQNPSNFIQNEINDDLKNGRYSEGIHTRFPPEPNGYLHIGHAKSICLNFGLAQQYGGMCNLRFDDTNPVKEDVEYVDSIQADVKWLGFSWDKRMYYASDYFEKLYEFAVQLIKTARPMWMIPMQRKFALCVVLLLRLARKAHIETAV